MDRADVARPGVPAFILIPLLGSADQLKAKATKPEQSKTIPVTVTARKPLEANSSRMVHHLPLGMTGYPLDIAPRRSQRRASLHSQKDSGGCRRIWSPVMILGNTRLGWLALSAAEQSSGSMARRA
jgi:hypothetical protein